MSTSQPTGSLYVIGVGPGDPDLMTLKAVRLIGMADVVVYPVTSNGNSRARRIVAEYITPHHETIGYALPMSVDPAPAQAAYDDVANQMRVHLRAGRTVALLCEGDPFLYGSGTHVYRRLVDDFATTVVPGVTSLTASAAEVGRPLAIRNEVFKVLPGPLASETVKTELKSCQSAAIIKLGRHFERIYSILRELGLLEHATLISNASADEQIITPLTDVDPTSGEYFAMILVRRDSFA